MCGLVGFYPKLNKKANFNNLVLLGIMNEERGIDSCGITIGEERLTGIDGLSKFRNFYNDNKNQLEKIDLVNKPIIIHTRKATGGIHNDKNAHPFLFYGTDGKYYLAGAHNGIITNRWEMEKTYLNSSYSKHLFIDSHYIILSLFRAGYSEEDKFTQKDILKTYEGTAALIFYDSNNTFKVWKGGSNNIEERPMYVYEDTNGWYFCSIESSLALVFKTDKVERLLNNQLLTFKNHKFVKSEIILRKHTVATTITNPYGRNYYPKPKDDLVVHNNKLRTLYINSQGLYCYKGKNNKLYPVNQTVYMSVPTNYATYTHVVSKVRTDDFPYELIIHKGICTTNVPVLNRVLKLYSNLKLLNLKRKDEFTKDDLIKSISEDVKSCIVFSIPFINPVTKLLDIYALNRYHAKNAEFITVTGKRDYIHTYPTLGGPITIEVSPTDMVVRKKINAYV